MLVLLEIFGLGEELLDELLALFLVSHLVLADDEPALVQHTGLVRQVLRACQLDLELMVVHDGWGDLLLRLIVGLLRDDIDFDEKDDHFGAKGIQRLDLLQLRLLHSQVFIFVLLFWEHPC